MGGKTESQKNSVNLPGLRMWEYDLNPELSEKN
jgi:hypothetical protein